MGSRVLLQSFNDNSAQGAWAKLNYTPRIQSLLRAANWDFARGQIALTVLKQAVVNGAASSNPPPQPWLYEYLYPPDCLRARFLQPTIQVAPPGTPLTTAPMMTTYAPPGSTAVPFVVFNSLDAQNNPIKTLLTNLPAAQLIYTRDLSQYPDLWDGLFLNGATALLSCYAINALARNAAQYRDAVASAKSIIDQARVQNGNETIPNVDHYPDWIIARRTTGGYGNWNQGPLGVAGYGLVANWDGCPFPDGQFY